MRGGGGGNATGNGFLPVVCSHLPPEQRLCVDSPDTKHEKIRGIRPTFVLLLFYISGSARTAGTFW